MSTSNYHQLAGSHLNPPPQYEEDSHKKPSPSTYSQQQPLISNQGVSSVDEDDFMYGPTLSQADGEIRRNFLKKVYAILTAQILGTALFSFMFYSVNSVQLFLFRHTWVVYLSCFAALLNIMVLFWKRHSYPTNFILLSSFTFLESIGIGTIVSFYKSTVVLQALFLTLGIFLALTLFVSQTRYDFSSFAPYLGAGLWVLIILSFIQIFFPFSSGFQLAIAIGSAFLFSAYIVVDTQMIMNRLSPEEYIVASVELYLDIINLFVALLRIFGSSDRD
ncbi:hypothetical protein DSO57_1024955 [Entomophthora muscae]|uniref:Uncharacterized protein n=1 Tax=Entomophthora muscae TaxID=34485 RepID=A0ACC2S4G0_9FUNG|nr:hypothetical protein DSO57_1024955 [Entomophthora muscae]